MTSVCGHGAVFDWAQIRAELDRADWEPDPDEPSQEMRTVWLGTIFGITPSGKFYAPFACSNVAGDCPTCKGSGTTKPRRSRRRVEKRRAARHARLKRAFIRRFGGEGWAPPEGDSRRAAALAWIAAHPAYRSVYYSSGTTCTACNGTGSFSAARDERWNDDLEEKARAIGAFVWHHDDSIFIAECREAEETEDEAANE